MAEQGQMLATIWSMIALGCTPLPDGPWLRPNDGGIDTHIQDVMPSAENVLLDMPLADVTMDGHAPIDGADAAGDIPMDLIGPDAGIDAPPASDVVLAPQTSCRAANLGCGQAFLDGGTFAMGDNNAYDYFGAGRAAAPVQPSITVSPFFLDQYEVTVARFKTFVNAGAPPVPGASVEYPLPAGALSWSGLSNGFDRRNADGSNYCNFMATTERDGHPMNCVDWSTAQAFCVWDGGRLPTEAELEFAARGVTNRAWPWIGSAAPPQSWVCSHRGSSLLGTCVETDSAYDLGRTPGPQPVSHLVGNVWEWAADWAQGYGSTDCWGGTARRNPLCQNGASGRRRTRGGSWAFGDAQFIRSGARADGDPTSRTYDFGFRCARTPR